MFYVCESLKAVTLPASIEIIGAQAFSGCSSLTDVYYGGSAAQWEEIEIKAYNESLNEAAIHYQSVGGGRMTDLSTALQYLYTTDGRIVVTGPNGQDIPAGTAVFVAAYDERGNLLSVDILSGSDTSTGPLSGRLARLFWVNENDLPKTAAAEQSLAA